jgi:hypothetical protein
MTREIHPRGSWFDFRIYSFAPSLPKSATWFVFLGLFAAPAARLDIRS